MKIDSQKIYVMMAKQQLSSAALAERVSISRQGLSRSLSKGSCKPETAGRIAAALDVDVADILQLPEREAMHEAR